MSKIVTTSITIAAPCAEIWRCLIDFSAYPDWNPFIHGIEGKAGLGEKLATRLHMADGSKMKFKPKIVEFEPSRKLVWLGHLLIAGLFDGRHAFELVPNPDGTTTFKHSESFSGVLVPLFWRGLEAKVLASFHKMNEALKMRVEQHS